MILRDIPLRLAIVSAVLWVGGLWAIGYLAVPVLFQALSDRQLAGMLAGKMFTSMAYVGMVCAAYLLLYQLRGFRRAVFKQMTFWVIVAMLAALLLGQFGIQPLMAELKSQALPLDVMHSAFAGQFRTLHGVASVLYLIQSLLGIVLVIRILPARNI